MTVPSWWVCQRCEVSWRGGPTCPHCGNDTDIHSGLDTAVTPAKPTWTSEVPADRRWTR